MTQYISQVLIPRLNVVDLLIYEGRYYEATKKQKSILRALYRGSDDDRKILISMIDEIDNIDKMASKVKDNAKCFTYWKRIMYKNKISEAISLKLDWLIWDKLHTFGYFQSYNKYGDAWTDPESFNKFGEVQ